MSTNFRPVLEKWGDASGTFVSPTTLEEILQELAKKSFSGTFESCDYSENRSIFISEGGQFLDYIDSKSIEELASNFTHSSSSDDLNALFGNMKNLTESWRELLNEDGSLIFYIDAY